MERKAVKKRLFPVSNEVGGPSPDQPLPDPNPKRPDDKGNVQELAEQVLSANAGPGQSPSLFARVTFANRDSREKILGDWVESQPENAKGEAEAIVAILKGMDLDNPFELDLSNKRNITSLPDVLQNCKTLECFNCTYLQSLPALPLCEKLDCSRCYRLQEIPELLACQRLYCIGCTSLQKIPELTACRFLVCSECTSLQEIPELTACINLNCSGCANLKSLSALPECIKLDCLGCYSLEKIPDLPECKMLQCIGCTSLPSLPALTECIMLSCSGCTSLQEILHLPVCKILKCGGCTSLKSLPALPKCRELSCFGCTSLRTLPVLQACKELNCLGCTTLEEIPELSVCTMLSCSGCTNLQALPELLLCEELYCHECTSLRSLPDLPVCKELNCGGCTNLQTLPELPACITLDCRNCLSLEALPESPLLEELFCDGCPNLVRLVWTRISPDLCTIGGVRYFPIGLPDELRAQLAPPVPDGALIQDLETDLQNFINGLTPSNLPLLQAEIEGQSDLESYKNKLTGWKELLFSRVQIREAYLGTPVADTPQLTEFYNQIDYYLLHLVGFLSKNPDAFIERLQILQTQIACGARFIAELEQLFSLNCVSSEHAALQNQFAQIASTQAKLAIEGMYPDGNVHHVNQAMFQLSEFLTGSYLRDHLSPEMDQEGLMLKFLKRHTSKGLVETILAGLKPSSPMEEVFTQYLKENFSPELTEAELQEVEKELTKTWNQRKETKIAEFNDYQRISKIEAGKHTTKDKLSMLTLSLTDGEKACESEESLCALLDSEEESFKKKNFKVFVQSKKEEILYQDHFDDEANKWKPEIIAKALQKMGILATLDELIPKP